MKVNEEFNVTVEKLSNLGFGITKIDGMVVFIENACPEDKLLIRIKKVNKNFANAEIKEIITPSSHRIEPFCPMQKVCGACQLQFIDYDYQLKIKQEIVKDTMRTIGNINIDIPLPVASPEIKEYRCKVQYPISQTKVSKRLLAGYYKPKSHETVNIKYCPIQPEICDRIINFIREKGAQLGVSGYNEQSHIGELRHVVIRYSKYNEQVLLTLVVNSNKISNEINELSKAIYNEFNDITGICINFNTKKSNLIMTDKSECVIGNNYIEEKLSDKVFSFGSNSFFQVNPKSAENIFEYVKNYIKNNFKNPSIFDAYAGVTAFGIVLSDICEKVVSVEENNEAVEWAKKTIKNNNISNIEINNMDAEKFFEHSINNQIEKFDITIIDPPRKGTTEKTLDYIVNITKNKIIYVSCNPATLARDLKYLLSKGAQLESIQPFDMFCHTYHIENVAIIDLKDVNK
ncbi:23S rRNA (uracil(1939)-C(5))-methyltransferase RlmD [bacterium]|nr:23S rRNA (uracil(1939)-C(5))-methyltransferase RlmD [bacterium]